MCDRWIDRQTDMTDSETGMPPIAKSSTAQHGKHELTDWYVHITAINFMYINTS